MKQHTRPAPRQQGKPGEVAACQQLGPRRRLWLQALSHIQLSLTSIYNTTLLLWQHLVSSDSHFKLVIIFHNISIVGHRYYNHNVISEHCVLFKTFTQFFHICFFAVWGRKLSSAGMSGMHLEIYFLLTLDFNWYLWHTYWKYYFANLYQKAFQQVKMEFHTCSARQVLTF